MNKKALIITDVTAPGGVDTYVCALEKSARELGWTTHVLMDQLPGSDKLFDMLIAGGATVTRAPLYHRCFSEEDRLRTTQASLDHFQPEVAHAVCGAPWNTIVPREAVLDQGMRLVFTEQYVAPGFYFENDDHSRIKAIYQKAEKIIAVSHDNARLLKEEYHLPDTNLVVIPNSVPMDNPYDVTVADAAAARRDLQLPEADYHVVTIARLAEQKGLDVLIRAVAKMKPATRERMHFSIIGDGPLRENLENMIGDLRVEKSITLHGWRNDAARLLPAFDLFILPSRAEGQPFALLEALAAQRPVIASAVSGIPELLEAGRGVLVEPEDADSLALSVGSFINDPRSFYEMALDARRFVQEHHDLRVNINRTVGLWANQL